jgi:radical SAM enzyme (TIGR01210 family)
MQKLDQDARKPELPSALSVSPRLRAPASPPAPESDAWIIAQRPARNQLDPLRPYAFLCEQERAESGELAEVATIFLTNRECPWRCVMCDLWRNTLTATVPLGAIPAQIDYALSRLPAARQLKLYNSGSFFDRGAIPSEDYPAIAQRARRFDRVIVECHPALVGQACVKFRDLLFKNASTLSPDEKSGVKLEVAMGLETVHPDVLLRLNKRMTLEQFARAADFLRQNEIALRVFILVKPPFLDDEEALHWAKCSLDFAFDCGATVASLLPTRFGNGALEALAERGHFSPPKLSTLEQAAEYGVGLGRGRVFADLWDLEKFSTCVECFPARLTRLREMNSTQIVKAPTKCAECVSSR